MNTIIEKIRAEVERMKVDYLNRSYTFVPKAMQDLLDFLSDLEKEEKPMEHKDIDTEIGHWWSCLDDKYYMLVNHYSIQDIKDTARHFAQWGAEHLRPADGKKWIYEDEYKKDLERLFNDGITIGKTKQKEQMMKEAVEGWVSTNGMGNKYLFPNYNDDFKDINDGDKVKLIIVKED